MEDFSIGHFQGHLHSSGFWVNDHGPNSAPFAFLGIKDPNDWIRKIVGYTPSSGSFPELNSQKDLLYICNLLDKLCKEKGSISSKEKTCKYKVGDVVEITRGRAAWNDEMQLLVGDLVSITEVYDISNGGQDCRIRFDSPAGRRWSWASEHGHFRLVSESPSETISLKKEQTTKIMGETPILISVCRI